MQRFKLNGIRFTTADFSAFRPPSDEAIDTPPLSEAPEDARSAALNSRRSTETPEASGTNRSPKRLRRRRDLPLPRQKLKSSPNVKRILATFRLNTCTVAPSTTLKLMIHRRGKTLAVPLSLLTSSSRRRASERTQPRMSARTIRKPPRAARFRFVEPSQKRERRPMKKAPKRRQRRKSPRKKDWKPTFPPRKTPLSLIGQNKPSM